MLAIDDRDVLWVKKGDVTLYAAMQIAKELGYKLLEFRGRFYAVADEHVVQIPARVYGGESQFRRERNNVEASIRLEQEPQASGPNTEGDEEARKVQGLEKEES